MSSGRTGRWGLAPIVALALALYAAFLVYPLVSAFIKSFTNANPLKGTADFIGFDNYAELVSDPDFYRALVFTAVVVVSVTILGNGLGLAFALLLNKPTANYKVMRTLIFIPQVLSGVIIGFIWRSMFNQGGLINSLLRQSGLSNEAINWLGTQQLATFVICVVVSWGTIAFSTVVFTASLQSVPAELYEAARVDGAGVWSRFRHVTFPMIAPALTINVSLSLITTLKLYDIIAVLTGGGPAHSTQSIAFFVIDAAFTQNRIGYASAIAIVLLLITALVSFTSTGLLRRREADL